MASMDHDDEGMYQPGDKPVPGYTLVRLLGRGSSGEAWQVCSDDGTEAALKIVNLRYQSRLKDRELDAIRKLKNARHNCLVGIHHVWLKDRDGNLRDTDGRIIDWAAYAKNPPPIARELPPLPPHGTASGGSSKALAPQRTVTQPANPSPPLGATIGGDDPSSDSHGSDTNPSPSPPPTDEYYESTRPRTGSTGGSGGDIAISREVRKSLTELFIVMSLGEMTLGSLLSREKAKGNKAIPIEQLRRYARDAANGIDFLNQTLKLQHCDIKPENILIIANCAQICDCGLARETVLDQGATSLLNGLTREYAAPEQFKRREQNYGQGTDQYSLANTYYVLRTGTNIYKPNADEWEIKDAKCNGKIDLSSPLVGRYERQALARGLAVDPLERYPTAIEMIEAVLQGYERDQQPRSKWKPVLAMAALLLVAAFATAGVLWGRQVVQLLGANSAGATSPALAGLRQAIQDENLDQIREQYKQLPSEELSIAGNMFLEWLEPRGQRLATLSCDEITGVKSASQMVATLFEERKKEVPEAQRDAIALLLEAINTQQATGIPENIKARLAQYLNQKEWLLALQLTSDPELAGGSVCASAQQDLLREQVFGRWFAELATVPLELRLEGLNELEDQLQEHRYVEKFGPTTKLPNLRWQQYEQLNQSAQEVVKRSDADWSPARNYWQLILADYGQLSAKPLQNADEEAKLQTMLLEAQLGRLLVDAQQNPQQPWQPAAADELAKLSAATPLSQSQQARLLLLKCLASWPMVNSDAVTASQLTEFLTPLEELSKLRSQLVSWEDERFEKMAITLSDRIDDPAASRGIRSPDERQRLRLLLGQLLPDRALAKLLEQAVEQLRTQPNGGQVQARLAEIDALLGQKGKVDARFVAQRQALVQWAKLIQEQIDASQFADFYAAVIANDADAYRADIGVALVAHAKRLPASQNLFIDQLGERAKATDFPAPFAQALDQLLVLRLKTRLLTAEAWKEILSDADRLLQTRQAYPNRELSSATIAAAWVEAQCQLRSQPPMATEQGKELLQLARQVPTNDDSWKTYRQYVLAFEQQSSGTMSAGSLAAHLKPLIGTLHGDSEPRPALTEWLQAKPRQIELAKMLWSFAAPQVPSDATLLKPPAQEKLLAALPALQLAQRLLPDELKKDAAVRPWLIRIAAGNALVELALLPKERSQTPEHLTKQVDSLLKSTVAKEELAKSESGPAMLQTLRYHALLAELRSYDPSAKPLAGWTPALQRLVANAADVTQQVFQFDFLALKEPQADFDLELYRSVVEPTLKLVPLSDKSSPQTPAEVLPALASLYAAHARLIERADAVETYLRGQGLVSYQADELRRASYERALVLEKRPHQRSRLALHLGCLLEDVAGDFTNIQTVEDLRAALSSEDKNNLVKICEEQSDFHGIQYLRGLRDLLAARLAAKQVCDVAKSREEQKQLCAAAHEELRSAVEQLLVLPGEAPLYEVRYQLARTTILVELAFLETQNERKVELLEAAVKQSDAAIEATQHNARFLCQAHIGKANAYEDLAFYCKKSERFADAEQSFQLALENATTAQLTAEVLYHLGRSEYRRAAFGMERHSPEDRRAVLKKAREYLQKSVDMAADRTLVQSLEATNYLADIEITEIKLDLAKVLDIDYRAKLAAYRPELATEALQLLAEVAVGMKKRSPENWSGRQTKYIDQLQMYYVFESQVAAATSSASLAASAADRKEALRQQIQSLLEKVDDPEFTISGDNRASLVYAQCILEIPRRVLGPDSPEQRRREAESRRQDALVRINILKNHRRLFSAPAPCDDVTVAHVGLWAVLFNQAIRLHDLRDACRTGPEQLRAIVDELESQRPNDSKIAYFRAGIQAWQLMEKLKYSDAGATTNYALLCDQLFQLRQTLDDERARLTETQVPALLGSNLDFAAFMAEPLKGAMAAANSPEKLNALKGARRLYEAVSRDLAGPARDNAEIGRLKRTIDDRISELDNRIRSLQAM